MRKEKNTDHSHVNQQPSLKVVDVSKDQSQLEREIDMHVNSIRALIKRLRPLDRQKYYEGLLSHLLSQPIEYPLKKVKKEESFDYCNLSIEDLSLIKELSVKIHELYRISEDEMKN
jgi:hypothetical protein